LRITLKGVFKKSVWEFRKKTKFSNPRSEKKLRSNGFKYGSFK